MASDIRVLFRATLSSNAKLHLFDSPCYSVGIDVTRKEGKFTTSHVSTQDIPSTLNGKTAELDLYQSGIDGIRNTVWYKGVDYGSETLVDGKYDAQFYHLEQPEGRKIKLDANKFSLEEIRFNLKSGIGIGYRTVTFRLPYKNTLVKKVMAIFSFPGKPFDDGTPRSDLQVGKLFSTTDTDVFTDVPDDPANQYYEAKFQFPVLTGTNVDKGIGYSFRVITDGYADEYYTGTVLKTPEKKFVVTANYDNSLDSEIPCVIQGVVTNNDAETPVPLTGAIVTLTDLAGKPIIDTDGNEIADDETDSAGVYSFAKVPLYTKCRVTVSMTDRRVVSSANNKYAYCDIDVQGDLSHRYFRTYIIAVVAITGTVIDNRETNALPIEGVMMYLEDSDGTLHHGVTDSSGVFTISVNMGLSGMLYVDPAYGLNMVSPEIEIENIGEATDVGDIVLEKYLAFTVRLYDSLGGNELPAITTVVLRTTLFNGSDYDTYDFIANDISVPGDVVTYEFTTDEEIPVGISGYIYAFGFPLSKWSSPYIILNNATIGNDSVSLVMAYLVKSTNVEDTTPRLDGRLDEIYSTVAHFLGYGRERHDETSIEYADVMESIRSGLRQFYYPAPINGKAHVWSFMKGVLEIEASPAVTSSVWTRISSTGGTYLFGDSVFSSYMAGKSFSLVGYTQTFVVKDVPEANVILIDESITIPVEDPVELYLDPDGRITLPRKVGAVNGKITIQGQTFYDYIHIMPEQAVRMMRNRSGATKGRPVNVALLPMLGNGESSQRMELILWPKPDIAYTLEVPFLYNPVALLYFDAFPDGGQAHMDTIIQSCLAAAELRINKESGFQNQKFMERITTSIMYDRTISGPDCINRVGGCDNGYNDRLLGGRWENNSITYNGEAL